MQALLASERSTEASGAFVPERHSVLDALSVAIDVAAGSASWLELANKLSELLEGQRTVLFLLDARNEAVDLLASSTPNLKAAPERFLQVARRHGRRLRARMPNSPLVGNSRLRMSAPALDDLKTWRAVLEPDSAFIGGQLLEASQTKYVCLACGPDEPGGDVCPVPEALIGVVLRHVARAAEIAQLLESASAQLNAATQVLDRFAVGVIQLDRNGTVIELNAAALRIAQARNGLTITTAGVHAVTEADEARLQKAIADAAAHRGGDHVERLSIRRRNGAPSSVAVASIDSSHRAGGGDQCSCVLFVIDPEARHELDPLVIVELLGLTLAEARVAAALAMGTPLAEAAAQLGITVNTARTLLARALAKTGTKSQTGLVRLVLTSLIPLPSSE